MGSKDTKKKVIDEESRVESGDYVRTPDGKNVTIKVEKTEKRTPEER
jgi:hypothetical protein